MQVLPLAVASPAQLQPVFSEELHDWRTQLHWDYGAAASLIKRHVNCRTLPGFFLVENSRAVGYCYYVIAPPMGYLGNVFVMREFASIASYELLLSHAVRVLQNHREVQRIESQVFGFNCDVSPILRRQGFDALLRYFMKLELDDAKVAEESRALSPDFRIVSWQRGYFLPAAEAIYDSYIDSPDRAMCHDYQSREGCIRFLRNLIENPGCGNFSPETSSIGLDAEGRVSGVLVTSIISDGTGMIPQISIRREAQGKGLGTALLTRYFKAARERGLQRISLSVSAQNERAHRLYSRLGFTELKEFYAYIWNRGRAPQD
ncbi:MAG TPA: GNAT family N-acetyltransferase [Acidobacteriota bacterium]|nr:GNAT family N-acetyltransferase [Acidobacteriota bacterium]